MAGEPVNPAHGPTDNVEEVLVAFVHARGPQFGDVTAETDLLEAGLLDSLLLVDMIFDIEERYKLRFSADLVTPSTFRTLARLAAAVLIQIKSN